MVHQVARRKRKSQVETIPRGAAFKAAAARTTAAHPHSTAATAAAWTTTAATTHSAATAAAIRRTTHRTSCLLAKAPRPAKAKIDRKLSGAVAIIPGNDRLSG